MTQLDHPQVGFGVEQKQPATLDDAVTATLEMESYLLNVPKPSVSLVNHEEDNSTIGTVRTEDKLTSLVERLIERVERLESSDSAHSRTIHIPKDSPRSAGLKGKDVRSRVNVGSVEKGDTFHATALQELLKVLPQRMSTLCYRLTQLVDSGC